MANGIMKIHFTALLSMFACAACGDLFRPAVYPADLSSLPEFVLKPNATGFDLGAFQAISGSRIRDDGYELGMIQIEFLEAFSAGEFREMMATPTLVRSNSDDFFWTRMEGWVGAFSELPLNHFSADDEVLLWEDVNGTALAIISEDSERAIYIWNARYHPDP